MKEDRGYYVYGWVNNDWDAFFYVGKGCGYRYKHVNGRSRAFDSIIRNWNCEPMILEDNLTELEAYEIEDELKRQFIFELGQPIIDGENKPINKMSQKEGIQSKKDRGEWADYGRPRVINYDIFKAEYQKVINGEIKPFDLARSLNMTVSTFYRYKARVDKELNK